jgi:hypothetical protein
VKFSQRGVSARFGKKGATIEDTVAGINAGNIDPNDFPPIRLVEQPPSGYISEGRVAGSSIRDGISRRSGIGMVEI